MRRNVVLLLVLLAAACVPRQQVQGTAVRAPLLQSDAAVMADAARLPLQKWAAQKPRAVIIGVHGMNDYAAAFARPGAWFARNGVTFYAYDQRGFGRAPGHGLWPGSKAMASDLRAVIALVRQKHPGLPVFVLGTSMGGAVAMKALAAPDSPAVDGLILAAPAVWGWSNLNLLYRSALWLGAHAAPGRTLSGQGLDILPSDNMPMLRALAADPLVIKQTRIDAVYGLVSLMEEGYRAAPALGLPVLLLYGAHDEIVPRKAVAAAARQIEAPLTLACYESGYHMLLRDLEAKTVWRDIARWTLEKSSAALSGAGDMKACFETPGAKRR